VAKTELKAWLSTHRDALPAVLLGASRASGGERSMLAAHPEATLVLDPGDEAGLRRAFARTAGGDGAWIGYLSYEFGLPFIGRSPRPTRGWPAALLRYYPRAAWCPTESIDTDCPPVGYSPLEPEQADPLHRARVAALGPLLHAGEVYEVNLARRFGRAVQNDPLHLFNAVVHRTPAPYAALIPGVGERWLVGTSPEGFLHLSPSGSVSTWPIKGTRPRRTDPAADLAERQALRTDPKELAEHLMVIDLMRNDLGRVAQAGSVTTGELFETVAYPKVWHMMTRVSAQLRPEIDRAALLAQTLPAGSITGAPKQAACHFIEAFEEAPRGPYCGTVICAEDNGALTANVIIRTGLWQPNRLVVQTGGGIVLDSDPEREVAETWLKLSSFV
jgi:para-aminobenzoate synthetase component 1